MSRELTTGAASAEGLSVKMWTARCLNNSNSPNLHPSTRPESVAAGIPKRAGLKKDYEILRIRARGRAWVQETGRVQFRITELKEHRSELDGLIRHRNQLRSVHHEKLDLV